MDECRQLKGQDIDRTTWRAVVLGFSALAAMSTSLGMYWLYDGPGWMVETAVAVIDAVLVTREWREIRTLKKRAITYLELPKEDGDEPPHADVIAIRGTS